MYDKPSIEQLKELSRLVTESQVTVSEIEQLDCISLKKCLQEEEDDFLDRPINKEDIRKIIEYNCNCIF